MTDRTHPEALMQLADDYAEASFDQGLHKRTLDEAPENARSVLAAAVRRQHAENERLAAMVDAQQPACDTARYCQSIQRCTAKDETRAQQPAPSAAAAPVAVKAMGYGGSTGINDYLMSDGTVQAMRPSEVKWAPQPSPTPQADSQPAAVRDERDDFEKVFPLPSGCIRVGIGYASTGYSNWAAHTHVERWQGWQARAARAPADSVTAPAGPSKSLPYEPTSAMLIAAREQDPALPIEMVRAIYWAMWRKAPTPPAQAADSVMEDADPLQGAANWLAEAHGQFCVAVLQGCLMIGYNRAKRLHDAAIAARKQGGAI